MNMEEIAQMTKLEERAEKAEAELNNEWEASRFLQAKLNTAEARVKELEAEREKLIGALNNKAFEAAVETFSTEYSASSHFSYRLEGFTAGWVAARAVLAEMKEQGNV